MERLLSLCLFVTVYIIVMCYTFYKSNYLQHNADYVVKIMLVEGVLMQELLDIFLDGIWTLITGVLEMIIFNVVFPVIGIALAIAGIYGAVMLCRNNLLKAFRGTRAKKKLKRHSGRVHIKNSPLFLACLQKVHDGELNTLYVNPYMACFNFNPSNINENDVLDFAKSGYASIPQEYIEQYYEQLIAVASKLSNVVSVKKTKFSFNAKPYLINNDYYNVEGTDVFKIDFEYRIKSNKNLKSFNIN